MFEVDSELDSDASGGNSTLHILCDPRFESMVLRAEVEISSGVSQADYQMTLNISALPGLSPKIPMATQGELDNNQVVNINMATWDLPPHIDAQQVSCLQANVDATETVNFRTWIFNFHKDASQRVPLAILMASLPRGSSQLSVASH